MSEPNTDTDDEPLDEPIHIGDKFSASDGPAGFFVEILDMYIDEDGDVQVRVDDHGEKRTVTVDDVVGRVKKTGDYGPGLVRVHEEQQ
jgi:hypothetical protein